MLLQISKQQRLQQSLALEANPTQRYLFIRSCKLSEFPKNMVENSKGILFTLNILIKALLSHKSLIFGLSQNMCQYTTVQCTCVKMYHLLWSYEKTHQTMTFDSWVFSHLKMYI